MHLKNQVILVVGGGRGIGRSIALFCAKEGAKVAVAARTQKDLEETSRLIQEQYPDTHFFTTSCDVSQGDDVVRAVRETEAKLGPIYGLVCAAGIHGPIASFGEAPMDRWAQAIDVNLTGTARCIHAVISGMKARKSGRIVLFSGGGQGAVPGFSAYVASKGGIWRLAETLAAELNPYGVFINSIAPGAVNTHLLDDIISAGPENIGKDLYEKSLRQKKEGGVPPEKAADLAVYLLSEASHGLSGKIISAVWDNYWDIRNGAELSKTDVFNVRRVVSRDGRTRE